MSEFWTRSPRDVDPLSWFTGPSAPLVFGGLALVYGSSVTALSMRSGLVAWFDGAAIAVMALGFVVISVLGRPRDVPAALTPMVAALLAGWIGIALSAYGRSANAQPIELWWAPVGLAFMIAALAPYSSARRILVLGSSSVVATAAIVGLVPTGVPPYWPTLSVIVLGSGPVLVGTVAAVVFAYQVVQRTTNWARDETRPTLSSGVLGEAAKLRILRHELASVGEQAIPLLRAVAERGTVTEDDRIQAQRIADELRAELVERSNRSWLDAVAARLNVTVLDAEHRADLMTASQRSALLGLLQVAATESEHGSSATVIQLRRDQDGSTAVALSTDVHFPEGRRLTLLAPHYFTLKAAVDGLEWETGDELRMRFRLPAGPDEP